MLFATTCMKLTTEILKRVSSFETMAGILSVKSVVGKVSCCRVPLACQLMPQAGMWSLRCLSPR